MILLLEKMKCVYLLVFILAIAGAFGEDCNVVPMTQWAGEPSRRSEDLPTPVSLVVIQHSVTPEASTDAGCESIAQAVRKYHMKVLKFDDIGQSFLICGNGRVYEGAGWTKVGAHTRTFNKMALGVSFIGEFNTTLPTAEAIKAALDLLSCGVMKGNLSENYKIIGHRQVSKTVSPGDMLQKEIETWPHWSSMKQK